MLVTQHDLMRPSFEEALEAALRGGARLIQLREKNTVRVLECAPVAAALCEKYGAQLQLNVGAQSLQLAREWRCGVHLPQSESVEVARRVLGAEFLIGQSVHSAAARAAQNGNADYLVFGAVFPTLSHPGEVPAGLETLRAVAVSVSLPVFAIGGVDAHNAAQCLQNGAHGVAAIRAVWDASDIHAATAQLCAIAQNASTHNA